MGRSRASKEQMGMHQESSKKNKDGNVLSITRISKTKDPLFIKNTRIAIHKKSDISQ